MEEINQLVQRIQALAPETQETVLQYLDLLLSRQ